MITLNNAAKDFAENNSSPGIQGRDEFYEILISVQKQAFEAGADWQRLKDAEIARELFIPEFVQLGNSCNRDTRPYDVPSMIAEAIDVQHLEYQDKENA